MRNDPASDVLLLLGPTGSLGPCLGSPAADVKPGMEAPRPQVSSVLEVLEHVYSEFRWSWILLDDSNCLAPKYVPENASLKF